MINVLQVLSDGYLSDVKGYTIVKSWSNGFLTIEEVIPEPEVPTSKRTGNGGAYYIIRDEEGIKKRIKKPLDREDEEILMIIKSFILCQQN